MVNLYYFPQPCNYSNEPGVASLRFKYGAEGYGVLCMLKERLWASSNGKLKYTDVKGVAFSMAYDYNKLSEIIEYCCSDDIKIFEDDGQEFWNEEFLKQREKVVSMVQKKRAGGNLGGRPKTIRKP